MANEFRAAYEPLQLVDIVWPSATGAISRAWLVLAKSDQSGGRGGHAYDDDPSSQYVSDSQVPNSRNIGVGDALVVWDQKRLLASGFHAGR